MSKNQEVLDQNIKENWFASVGVRKPYTIFVCIMAIIILGVFSFSKMSVDLFPSMDLPYAVVVLSPNQSYLTEEVKDLAASYTDSTHKDYTAERAQAFQTKVVTKVITNAKQFYTDEALYGTHVGDFQTILQNYASSHDATTLESDLGTAIYNGNLVAKYYAEQQEAVVAEVLLAEVMPDGAKLEKLTNEATQAISSVTGIKNTQTTTMLSLGVVMMSLEYNSGAT